MSNPWVRTLAANPLGLPISGPEAWAHGNDRAVRPFLDFRDGHSIGPVAERDSDFWLLELETEPR